MRAFVRPAGELEWGVKTLFRTVPSGQTSRLAWAGPVTAMFSGVVWCIPGLRDVNSGCSGCSFHM